MNNPANSTHFKGYPFFSDIFEKALSAERFFVAEQDLSSLEQKHWSIIIDFVENHSIRYLSIIECNLTFIPKEFKRLKRLTNLDLSNNTLAVLPPEIGELSELKSLCLVGNLLEELPYEIGKLENLNYLNLRNNKLQLLNSGIGSLKNLISIELSNNFLEKLPDEIGKLKNLYYLTVKNNKLLELPREIGELESVTFISFSENNLKDVPSEICNLKKLNTIFLDDNCLEILPPEIVAIRKTTYIHVMGNNIKGFDMQSDSQHPWILFEKAVEIFYNTPEQWLFPEEVESALSVFGNHIDKIDFPDSSRENYKQIGKSQYRFKKFWNFLIENSIIDVEDLENRKNEIWFDFLESGHKIEDEYLKFLESSFFVNIARFAVTQNQRNVTKSKITKKRESDVEPRNCCSIS